MSVPSEDAGAPEAGGLLQAIVEAADSESDVLEPIDEKANELFDSMVCWSFIRMVVYILSKRVIGMILEPTHNANCYSYRLKFNSGFCIGCLNFWATYL